MSDPRGEQRRGKTQRLPASEAGARGEPRRTERLAPTGDEWSQAEPVNPGWRSERAAGRTGRRSALPRSPQEFQLWLQAGGWRYVAGIAALLVVLLIALLAFARNEQRAAGFPRRAETTETTLPAVGVGAEGAVLPTVTVAPTVPPTPSFFVVTGTDGQGLFLRPGPSTEGEPITTLPDGTRLEQIGEDVPGPDRVWRQVRAPDGQEGYVAVDFLTPAP